MSIPTSTSLHHTLHSLSHSSQNTQLIPSAYLLHDSEFLAVENLVVLEMVYFRQEWDFQQEAMTLGDYCFDKESVAAAEDG